ncbi:MAG: SRPBCC domain-containing protein [Acidimicrobiales bacterium]|nr:SRPBCC domain-containing protein [Acidimicrobiales bacterium]
MITQLFTKPKTLNFERTYEAPVETVWRAWTQPDMLRSWWGPKKTSIPECEIDLTLGGRIHVVMEATEEMGKYQGTRWPMTGTFTEIEENSRLSYDARSWTEGEEAGTTIHHTNTLTLSEANGTTTIKLEVSITQIGAKAKMAAFGMKWGYKQQFDKLKELLERRT